MMWEPIDSAPKDGSWIIGATKAPWIKAVDWFPYPLKYQFRDGDWYAEDGNTYDLKPTHWMSPHAQPGAS